MPFYSLTTDHSLRYLIGGITGVFSFFAPVQSLVVCALVFIAIDFITGVMASRKRARKNKTPWGFESAKAWNTVAKVVFVTAGIVLAWLIDTYILHFMSLRLANLFTGFVCGVELWSYLENAAEISQHPVFRWLKKFMKKKIDDAIDGDTSPDDENETLK